ncbi:MAG: uroporphyrinogen-III C-methyltransferase [Rhodocyclaceae bacterium]|jgi:uroporphyrin-3 C-methyltransferase|nr:uroporphyrinogen-III C-methyltransferase [Rhodocyclaceae bacterium]
MPPDPASAPSATDTAAPLPPPAEPVRAPANAFLAALRRPPVLIAVLALALLGWQWVETRSRLSDVREELAKRLSEGDAVAREARALARQDQESVQALQAKLGVLEAKLAETQGQQLALDAMYQELSRSRDERLLAEVEQAVSIAAQQLQLAGNIEAALIALQGADARLGRGANARFLGLRKLLARDIERLKGMSTADVPGIALRLETVVAVVDTLPLAYEQRPKVELPTPHSRSPVSLSFWQALALDVWNDTKQLVRIERIDHPEPGLLSPSQNFFLRENLKLRLVNARLALLARDGKSFREDIRQSRDWLERYFDTHAKPVQAAQATLKALAATGVATELPSLDETLNALRNFKVAQEKK